MYGDIEGIVEYDVLSLVTFIESLYSFFKKKFDFKNSVRYIKLLSDKENAKKILARTGYYDPQNFEIAIYVNDRHPKDVLRSISHELIHHYQNDVGKFDMELNTQLGYAQKNPILRGLEIEAYKLGSGIYFRDWEDNYKKGIKVMNEWIEKENAIIEETLELLNEGKKKKKSKKKDEKEESKEVEDIEVETEVTTEVETEVGFKEVFAKKGEKLYETLMKRWIK